MPSQYAYRQPDMHTIKLGMHTAKPVSSHFQNRKIFHFLKVDKIGDENPIVRIRDSL